MMKDICPNCEKIADIERVRSVEEILVRGETVSVSSEYLRCLDCGEEFDDPGTDNDPLDKAYHQYRQKHGMVQPEQMKEFRSKLGLTQSELSKILGFGGATLSRYENGALQDDAHDRTLRLAMEPHNLIRLVDSCPDALPDTKRIEIIEKLKAEEKEANPLDMAIVERFGSYDPSVQCGYKRLDVAKLLNAILLFCRDGLWKTKLNKLLFYSDFLHFRNSTVSITGVRYIRLQHGPAPDGYDFFLSLLGAEGYLTETEMIFPGGYSGNEYRAVKQADLSIFSESELICLLEVKKFFQGFGAKQISDYSHQEKAYQETADREFISYGYADELQLEL